MYLERCWCYRRCHATPYMVMGSVSVWGRAPFCRASQRAKLSRASRGLQFRSPFLTNYYSEIWKKNQAFRKFPRSILPSLNMWRLSRRIRCLRAKVSNHCLRARRSILLHHWRIWWTSFQWGTDGCTLIFELHCLSQKLNSVEESSHVNLRVGVFVVCSSKPGRACDRIKLFFFTPCKLHILCSYFERFLFISSLLLFLAEINVNFASCSC